MYSRVATKIAEMAISRAVDGFAEWHEWRARVWDAQTGQPLMEPSDK
jgi:hypothetical protein